MGAGSFHGLPMEALPRLYPSTIPIPGSHPPSLGLLLPGRDLALGSPSPWDPDASSQPFSRLSRPCPPIHPGGPSAGPLGNASRGGSLGNTKQVQPLQSPFERDRAGLVPSAEPGQEPRLLGAEGTPVPGIPPAQPPAHTAHGSGGDTRGSRPSQCGSHVGVGDTAVGSPGSPRRCLECPSVAWVVRGVGYGVSDVGCPTWDAGFGI